MFRAPAVILLCMFASEQAWSQSFSLQTEEAGLQITARNGVAVADMDRDGDLDVYLVGYLQHDPGDASSWNRMYRNNGDGTFTDLTSATGATASHIQGYEAKGMGNKFGAAWGDYDNDGDPDLYLTNVGPEILYRNSGNGFFTDVTEDAGVGGPDDDYDSSSALWWDYDHDGDLDLYVGTWNGRPNRMYENNGDGTFKDVSQASGLENAGSTWSMAPLDANGDGRVDLYTVNDFGRNKLYVNQGDKTFAEETEAYGLEDAGNGMGVTVGDYNNDGLFDIYLTNIYGEGIQWNPLFTNTGSGFTDQSQALGVDNADWAWGTSLFDSDHDGDLDLYVANGFVTQPAFPNRFFRNELVETGSVGFTDTAPTAGVDGTAEARGLAVFDYDNDGDLDILVANQRAGQGVDEDGNVYLYRNDLPLGNWLKVVLQGTLSNRDGYGAVVRFTTSGKSQYRQHDGAGFLGQSLQPIHVGLGSDAQVDEIRVHWPSGLVESYFDVRAKQVFRIVEGEGVPTSSESVESPAIFDLQIYPNPAVDRLTVDLGLRSRGSVSIEVTDLLGRPLIKDTMRGSRHLVDLRSLTPGLYFVRVIGSGQRQRTQPLIVR